MKEKELLEEFIRWARECGNDAFYIFDEPEEAIELFLNQREIVKGDSEVEFIKYEESPYTSPKVIDKRPKNHE